MPYKLKILTLIGVLLAILREDLCMEKQMRLSPKKLPRLRQVDLTLWYALEKCSKKERMELLIKYARVNLMPSRSLSQTGPRSSLLTSQFGL